MHLVSLALLASLAPLHPHLVELLIAGLMLGQVVLLAMWVSLGPPPLGRRVKHAAIAGARKKMVGSGDRSERIRTYNFPQERVTDHRIGLTLYKLTSVMEGDLDEVIDPLIAHHRAELLKVSEDAAAAAV